MKQRVLVPIFLILFFSPAVLANTQPNRSALAIGNGQYPSAPLKNPVNDASDMGARLEASGFKVTLLRNATKKQMETAVRSFGLDLARQKGVGLFYFAGHGNAIKMVTTGKNPSTIISEYRPFQLN